MKKSTIALLILLLLAVSPLVSAQITAPPLGAPDLEPGSFGLFIYEIFEGFFNFIGVVIDTTVKESFYPKVLLFILFVVMIYPVVNRIEAFRGNAAMSLIVTLIIATLGSRFLTDHVVNLIMIPYGALAILATTIIPLMILFTFTNYFIPSDNELLRTIVWVVAAVSFFGLLIHRWDDVGAARVIYLLGGCLSLIAAVFQHRLKEIGEEDKPFKRELNRVRARLARVHHELARAEAEGDRAAIEPLEKEVKELRIAMKNLKKELYGGWYPILFFGLIVLVGLTLAWIYFMIGTQVGWANFFKDVLVIK